MAPVRDPRINTLHTLLSGIYGRPVPVDATAKFEPGPVKPCAAAVYIDNQDQPVGLLICTLAAAGYLGAALSLLPKSVADDCIKKAVLDPALLENFQEVANICSSLFTEHIGTRVHLKTTVAKLTAPPPEFKAFLQSAVRTDVTLEIPGYGPGFISIRMAKAVST